MMRIFNHIMFWLAVVLGLWVISIFIINCSPNVHYVDNRVSHSRIPAHVVEAHSPETKINMRYYLTRSYVIKDGAELIEATEIVTPDDEVILPPDTTGFVFTAQINNPEKRIVDIWKHIETKKFNTFTLFEFDLNKRLVYSGKVPTKSYQLRLPIEDNHRYRFYVEMKKGGANDLIFKTVAFRYWKQL